MGGQLSLLKLETEHGGNLSLGKSKSRRPLSTKKPLHVVLRSSKACGPLSLLKQKHKIESILRTQADRWQIRVFEHSVNGNHIHLAILGKSRTSLQNFFRSFAGLVARLVTGAEKSRPFGKFWDSILWTRLIEWGKALRTVRGYIVRNVMESMGLIPYERVKTRRRKTVLRV